MIRVTVVTALASLMATSAHAATVWQGEAIIDTATAQCGTIPSAAIKTDSVLKSVLKPKNIPGNDANTSISFIGDDIAMFAIVLDHGAMPAGTAAGFGNTTSGLIKANQGIVYSAFVQSPATIVAATDGVTLRGRITDFMFVTNCDVTFRAAYSKRD